MSLTLAVIIAEVVVTIVFFLWLYTKRTNKQMLQEYRKNKQARAQATN